MTVMTCECVYVLTVINSIEALQFNIRTLIICSSTTWWLVSNVVLCLVMTFM